VVAVLSLNNVWGTITPQHLTVTRADLFKDNKFNPYFYCMPVVKTASDREALIMAATSGNSKFFAGTDSAPHVDRAKRSSAAGCFTAPYAIQLYAEVFYKKHEHREYSSSLLKHTLEAFLVRNSAEFYGWSLPDERIILKKETVDPSDDPAISTQFEFTPFMPYEELMFSV
jgi:dihydroorotase